MSLKKIAKFITKNPLASLGLLLVLANLAMVLFAPQLAPYDPEQMQLILKNQQQFLTIFQQQLAAVIKEQAKTNSLLLALIEAMGEGDGEDESGPGTYLDGSPMR